MSIEESYWALFGGLVVSLLPFYSDDVSLNIAKANSFLKNEIHKTKIKET